MTLVIAVYVPAWITFSIYWMILLGNGLCALSEQKNMGGKTKRAMLSERSEVGSRDVSVSYGAMS